MRLARRATPVPAGSAVSVTVVRASARADSASKTKPSTAPHAQKTMAKKGRKQSHDFKPMTITSPGACRDFAILFSCFAPSVLPLQRRLTLQQIAAAARGHVGAAVRLVETGESFGLHQDEHFPMQSVYKLPIAMAVLHANLPLDKLVHIAKSDLVPRGSA